MDTFLALMLTPFSFKLSVETKGLDFVDKQKAKRHAEEQLDTYYTPELHQ
jgi:hypothetical protein